MDRVQDTERCVDPPVKFRWHGFAERAVKRHCKPGRETGCTKRVHAWGEVHAALDWAKTDGTNGSVLILFYIVVVVGGGVHRSGE